MYNFAVDQEISLHKISDTYLPNSILNSVLSVVEVKGAEIIYGGPPLMRFLVPWIHWVLLKHGVLFF